nr:immunoglobulin light chain junction region [Macaca mulatta]
DYYCQVSDRTAVIF